MRRRRYDLSAVKAIVEIEGLGRAVDECISWDDIEDEVLLELWLRATAILDLIAEYLRIHESEEIIEEWT